LLDLLRTGINELEEKIISEIKALDPHDVKLYVVTLVQKISEEIKKEIYEKQNIHT
jgi:hypothetical protein